MKLVIVDTTMRHRSVEVPDKCPGCGASLRESGAMRVYGHQEQNTTCAMNGDDDDPDLEWSGSMNNGESFRPEMYLCNVGEDCEEILAENVYRLLDEKDPVAHLLVYRHKHGEDTELYSSLADALNACALIMLEYLSDIPEEDVRADILAKIKAKDFGAAATLFGSTLGEDFDIIPMQNIIECRSSAVGEALAKREKEIEDDACNESA